MFAETKRRGVILELSSTGDLMQKIYQMAHDLYEALDKREDCSACHGQGYVLVPLAADEYGDDEIMSTQICGCSKRAEDVLKKYESEAKLLRSMFESELESIKTFRDQTS